MVIVMDVGSKEKKSKEMVGDARSACIDIEEFNDRYGGSRN